MSKNEEAAIIVKDLYKSFKLPHEQHSGIKQKIVNILNTKRGYEEQKVLKGVSFEIKKGEFFGIVGRNGSGKSTLLKLLAGIYTPDRGLVQVNGSLTPFIELGVGFNPELTGRENLFLNGALLGFDRKQVESMYDEIVEFAELEKFMDQKLKNYSSGMQVRLAFSIAIRAESDILVLDEVLAVGDESFQRKCNDYFTKIKEDKTKTIILVTHGMENVRKYCNRAIFVRDGEIVSMGNPDKVADKYSLDNFIVKVNKEVSFNKNTKKPYIKGNINGSPLLKNSESLQITLNYKSLTRKPVYVKIVLFYMDTVIMVANSKILYGMITSDQEEHVVNYKLPLESFNYGEYSVVLLLVDDNVNIADYGYDKELIFKISNIQTGRKIGGAMKNVGSLEMLR